VKQRFTMPEEPKKENPASESQQLTSAGIAFPGSGGNDHEPFPYFVQIGDVYDGPLDLLLALIKKQNLDVWDLPIGKITAQFLAYVKTIPPEEADSAAEFCYMASQLIVIKSRMLLPIERAAAENGAAEDPRKSLVERLLEYAQVKQAAEMLAERQKAESATWTRSEAGSFRDGAIRNQALSTHGKDSCWIVTLTKGYGDDSVQIGPFGHLSVRRFGLLLVIRRTVGACTRSPRFPMSATLANVTPSCSTAPCAP
jgi:hypothetical protein